MLHQRLDILRRKICAQLRHGGPIDIAHGDFHAQPAQANARERPTPLEPPVMTLTLPVQNPACSGNLPLVLLRDKTGAPICGTTPGSCLPCKIPAGACEPCWPRSGVIIEAIDDALHNFIAGQVFDFAAHREGPAHSGLVAVYRLGAVVDDHLRAGPVAGAHQGDPGLNTAACSWLGMGRCWRRTADAGCAIFLHR